LFKNNKQILRDPVTGKDVEFEVKNMYGSIWYRDPAIKDPKSPAAWTNHPTFPREDKIDYGILETTSILQRFFGLPGLTTAEQTFIIAEYLEDKITEDQWNLLRNTMTEQGIVNVKRALERLVNDRVQRTVEANQQKADTDSLKKFYDSLPFIGNRLQLPCGHKFMRRGAVMTNYDRMVRDHPDIKQLGCQVCGAKFDTSMLKSIISSA